MEVEVLERVVFGPDGEAIIGRVGRDPVWDRPRRQRTIVLEPKIPVQARRVVLLDDEAAVRPGARRRLFARRLCRGAEVALGSIAVQGHVELG